MQPSGGMPYAPRSGAYPPPMVPGWAIPAPPQPRPRGTPNRSLFMAGAPGNFIAAGVSVPFAAFAPFLSFGFGFGVFGVLSLFAPPLAVLLGTALVVSLLVVFGFFGNHGCLCG